MAPPAASLVRVSPSSSECPSSTPLSPTALLGGPGLSENAVIDIDESEEGADDQVRRTLRQQALASTGDSPDRRGLGPPARHLSALPATAARPPAWQPAR